MVNETKHLPVGLLPHGQLAEAVEPEGHKLGAHLGLRQLLTGDTGFQFLFRGFPFKMVITFNHKEGMDTITFEDLKASPAAEKSGSDLDCLTAPKKNKLKSRFKTDYNYISQMLANRFKEISSLLNLLLFML